MPARLPRLQRKVIHKVPGDIDVDAIVVPKCSDQSYSQVCSKTRKVGRCQQIDMTRTMPARLPKLQQRKVTHKVPGNIDIDAIMIPKCNGQGSHTVSVQQDTRKVGRCQQIDVCANQMCTTARTIPVRLAKCNRGKSQVPDNIGSDQYAARCSLSLSLSLSLSAQPLHVLLTLSLSS